MDTKYLKIVLAQNFQQHPDGFDMDIPIEIQQETEQALTDMGLAFTVVGSYEDNVTISICRTPEQLSEREAER